MKFPYLLRWSHYHRTVLKYQALRFAHCFVQELREKTLQIVTNVLERVG